MGVIKHLLSVSTVRRGLHNKKFSTYKTVVNKFLFEVTPIFKHIRLFYLPQKDSQPAQQSKLLTYRLYKTKPKTQKLNPKK